jgi:signal transduction histidine kinase/ActR/RegA family two-component response regulator
VRTGMHLKFKLPASLTRRFALGAAGLAVGVLLLTALASWWLLTRQHDEASRELAARERQFHAQTVSMNLISLAARMSEVAGSTILATGLMDSAGKELYLRPFLESIRQVNGMAVQVLFTDFEGGEIAGNNGRFDEAQRQWVRQQLQLGRPASAIFTGPEGSELLTLEPLIYSRTRAPEGGLAYKIALDSLHTDEHMQLHWGPAVAGEPGLSSPVNAPAVFGSLGFRIQDKTPLDAAGALSPPFLTIFFLLLALFAAVVLAGSRMASMLTHDLRQLQLFAGDLVRDGLSQERAVTTGTEEVASLSAAINQMLDRLYAQRQALTREGEKLLRMAAALKLADKRKDEFVAMLAHELRNPLAPIMSGADLLSVKNHDDPLIERTAGVIGKQARHMARIIDDLLDVSRITRGQVTLKMQTVDFALVVNESLQQIRPLIETNQHHFAVSLSPGHMLVSGDHARLVQVTSNLLENAAKYTPPGGYLELKVTMDKDELCLTVGDNGSGIDPELMPDIFELFTQGERTPDRHQGGLGLGLALVKSLVQLHGGRVAADSPGLGKGARFSVYLPASGQAGLTVPVVPAAPRPLGGSLKLHLVDDNADAALMLARLLEMDDYEVVTSLDAHSTLHLVLTGLAQPDVFILDIGMPDMDGYALARKLREDPRLQNTRLIALTGYGQESDRAKSAAAGFDHHLVKPVSYQELKDLLSRIETELLTAA